MGINKKGLGHGVTEKFSKNKDVISVGYANGRASDIFDEQQFGSASEAEILTLIVKDNKSNAIFDELYEHLKLSKEKMVIFSSMKVFLNHRSKLIISQTKQTKI